MATNTTSHRRRRLGSHTSPFDRIEPEPCPVKRGIRIGDKHGSKKRFHKGKGTNKVRGRVWDDRKGWSCPPRSNRNHGTERTEQDERVDATTSSNLATHPHGKRALQRNLQSILLCEEQTKPRVPPESRVPTSLPKKTPKSGSVEGSRLRHRLRRDAGSSFELNDGLLRAFRLESKREEMGKDGPNENDETQRSNGRETPRNKEYEGLKSPKCNHHGFNVWKRRKERGRISSPTRGPK